MLIKLEECRNYSQRNKHNDIKQLVPSIIMLLITAQFQWPLPTYIHGLHTYCISTSYKHSKT